MDEIKSTTKDLEDIEEDFNELHWAQVKCRKVTNDGKVSNTSDIMMFTTINSIISGVFFVCKFNPS